MTEKVAVALWLGEKFWVEPPGGDRIPVQVTEIGWWGLVHNVIEIPCRRLDTHEGVVVGIGVYDVVELIEEEEA